MVIYVYMYINNQSNNIGLFITGVKCTILLEKKIKGPNHVRPQYTVCYTYMFFVTNNNRPQCSMFILLFYCYYDLLNIVGLCCLCFFLETVLMEYLQPVS